MLSERLVILFFLVVFFFPESGKLDYKFINIPSKRYLVSKHICPLFSTLLASLHIAPAFNRRLSIQRMYKSFVLYGFLSLSRQIIRVKFSNSVSFKTFQPYMAPVSFFGTFPAHFWRRSKRLFVHFIRLVWGILFSSLNTQICGQTRRKNYCENFIEKNMHFRFLFVRIVI